MFSRSDVRIHITGQSALFAKLEAKKKQQTQRFRSALFAAGLWLFNESQKIVPVMTGDLRASGQTDMQRRFGNLFIFTISYSTDYAVDVHEDQTKRHGRVFNAYYAYRIAHAPANDPVFFNRKPEERSKFLEAPMRSGRATMRAIIRENAK